MMYFWTATALQGEPECRKHVQGRLVEVGGQESVRREEEG